MLEHLVMNYLFWLSIFSILLALLERIWPARQQKVLRTWLWSDVFHLIFNGHFLGVMLYGIAFYHVIPWLDTQLVALGWQDLLYFNMVKYAEWGIILQSCIALFVIDLIQWGIHNLLHKSSFLWQIHQVHHSVKEGEMDWIVSFRFSWLEVVIYKSIMYVPVMWFGFEPQALFFHAVFGTLIGHLNHANVTWDYGVLRYLINNPKMHLYHHAYDAPTGGQNFGIIFSCWDYLFKTAYVPHKPCSRIGFQGVDEVPNDFFAQLIWPLPKFIPQWLPLGTHTTVSVAGVLILGVLYGASRPVHSNQNFSTDTQLVSKNQSKLTLVLQDHASTRSAIAHFGRQAQVKQWARSEFAVEASELALALGAQSLIVLDVRSGADAKQRFEAGHIPTAQFVQYELYAHDESMKSIQQTPITTRLTELLITQGIDDHSVVVIMGDGGFEPYALWWDLWKNFRIKTRILNGGLASWKAIGGSLVHDSKQIVHSKSIHTQKLQAKKAMQVDLSDIKRTYPHFSLLDTRSLREFYGTTIQDPPSLTTYVSHRKHLHWTKVFKWTSNQVAVLKNKVEMQTLWKELALKWNEAVVMYNPNHTYSAAILYALIQAGYSEERVWNSNGIWTECVDTNHIKDE